MVSQFGRGPRDIGEPLIVGQQLGEPGVQPGAFARQQVGVDGLAEQGVPERIAMVAVGHQQLVGDRLPDRGVVDRSVEP